VITSDFGLISHRFCDTATFWPKVANFPYLTLTLRPFEFLDEPYNANSRVMGYPSVKISWL